MAMSWRRWHRLGKKAATACQSTRLSSAVWTASLSSSSHSNVLLKKSLPRLLDERMLQFSRARTVAATNIRTLTTITTPPLDNNAADAANKPVFDRASIRGPHGSYDVEYHNSIEHSEAFWSKAAEKLEWYRNPSKILEHYMPPTDSSRIPENAFYRWFSDGMINTCYNCLDVHVQNNRGDQVAMYYDSPLTQVKKQFTYQQMLEQVSTLAGALQDLGVTKGDRVVIYMPMIPEAIFSMLACTRIGAVHSVVFGGFAAPELATRIGDCQPKLILSASAGVEPGNRVVPYKPLLDKALSLAAHNVKHCVIVQRHNIANGTCDLVEPRDLDYDQVMARASPVPAVPVEANHPHYILYTSGTTGLPKGVVRDTAGWAVALKYSMSAFYDTNPGETFWAASDIGWVVGHSYIVYAPLLNGCSTVLYEGKPVGTPDAGAFWRVVEEYKVKSLFAAPTAIRAMKQADPHAEHVHRYNLSSLKSLFLAGEHSDPGTLHWCETVLAQYGVSPVDHWWQTELGWPGVGNAVGLGRIPIRYGSCGMPVPGYRFVVLDDKGQQVPAGTLGNLAIQLPLPPGTLLTLYNNDHRYVKDYLTKFPGYYDSGDAAFIDDDGYVHIMGRTDDVINTAGHRLSTGTMEEILMDHPDVADCAVIGVNDALKGQIPVGFVVTNVDCTKSEADLCEELVQQIRHTLGPVASFKKVAVVKALPKTRSGKILRGTMAKIANGKPYAITPTIEDPKIFEYLEPEILKLVNR